jgi:hypothetical protein
MHICSTAADHAPLSLIKQPLGQTASQPGLLAWQQQQQQKCCGGSSSSSGAVVAAAAAAADAFLSGNLCIHMQQGLCTDSILLPAVLLASTAPGAATATRPAQHAYHIFLQKLLG